MRRMSSLRPQISWMTTMPGSEPAAASTSRGRARAAAREPPAGSEMRTSSVPKAAMTGTLPKQRGVKRAIVVDALRRIAHMPEAPVGGEVVAIAPEAYRTTVRLGVDGAGRAAYRRRHGHDLVDVDSCLIAHPRLEELIVEGRFP